MTDTIQIKTGAKRIAIEDNDGNIRGEISFNPSDMLFVERYYKLRKEVDAELSKYVERAQSLTDDQEEEAVGLARELCEFMNGKIDELFGAGTSQIAFDGAMDLGDFELQNGTPVQTRPSMYEQFLTGVAPYIRQVRTEAVDKYAYKGKKSRKSK